MAREGPHLSQALDSRGRPVRNVFRLTRSDGTFYYRCDVRRGKQRARVYGGLTLTDARAVLQRVRHEIRIGTFETRRDRMRRMTAAATSAAAERGPTFADFADRFLTEYGDLRRSDYYRQRLRPANPARGTAAGPIRRHFGERFVREITAADLDAYRRARSGDTYQGKQVSAGTVRKDLTLLGTVFRMAKRWGVVQANPAADMEKPKEPEPQARPLTAEEWAVLQDQLPPWIRSLSVFALSTGARLKEVTGLRWADVDFRGGFLYFSPDSKTARSKRVKMGAAARGILEEQDRRRREIGRATATLPEYVFLRENGGDFTAPRDRNRISQRFAAIARSADFPWATFKSLRTTAASWAEEEGVAVGETQRLLGHADVRTTQRFYTRTQADRTAGAVAALDRRLLNSDTKRTHTLDAAGELPVAALDGAC